MSHFKVLIPILLLVSYPVFAQEQENYIDGPSVLLKDYSNVPIIEGMGKVNDVLYEVLALTYQNNSTIRAARAELLAVKEQLAQAESGYLPNISADFDVTHTDTDSTGDSFITSDGGNTSKSASLNLKQPIFKGGTTRAKVKQAQNTIAAQKFNLSETEQKMLYEAVVAYMNLYRDQAVYNLQKNNQRLVAKELDQALSRFKVGEITRTDVSQSEARLAEAKAGVIDAQAAVKTSMATFGQVVGSPPPVNMGYPVVKFKMPQTLTEAIELAETNNREIIQARFYKRAANSQVSSLKGELLPQISAIGRLDKSYDQSDFIEEQRQAAIGLSASIPLYMGGATRSRIREAKKVEMQRAEQINMAKDSVKQQVISNWEIWESARAETLARISQVDAAAIAQEGVHYEAEYGERTTLDVLNANQELLNAQVELLKTKRDEIVARFALAQTLGLLVPQNLGFSTVKP